MTDSVAVQTGFGFAAYLITATLLDKLAEHGVLSAEQTREILDHALLNAETHQTSAPSPEMVAVARKVISMTLTVSEVKRHQKRGRPPSA